MVKEILSQEARRQMLFRDLDLALNKIDDQVRLFYKGRGRALISRKVDGLLVWQDYTDIGSVSLEDMRVYSNRIDEIFIMRGIAMLLQTMAPKPKYGFPKAEVVLVKTYPE